MSFFRNFVPGAMHGSDWKKTGQFMFGKGAQTEKLPAMNKNQMSYLKNILGQLKGQNIDLNQSSMFQQGQSYLGNLLQQQPGTAQEEYNAYSAPMMRQFNEQEVPQMAEQFAGVGGMSSSGFQQSLSRMSDSLKERLMALSMGLNQQKNESLYNRQMAGVGQGLGYAQAPMQNAYNFGNMGLSAKPFGYNFKPATQGLVGGMAQGVGQGMGSAGMAAML